MTNGLRLLFFGTSEFAVPTLQLLADSSYEVLAVYTQPDRPAGRGRNLRPTPVAAAARELGLPIEQPERIRSAGVLQQIRDYAPEAVVLAAYGLLIPPAALEVPRLGWLNVHPSLLPRYRGASPVVAPLLAGNQETGVSIFLMREGLDDGPILAQERTLILPSETAGELTDRLARVGADLLLTTLDAWASGNVRTLEQDDERATYAPKINKEDALIEWEDAAEVVARRVQAYNPWPVAYTYLGPHRLRILRARPSMDSGGRVPGEVFLDADSQLPAVACRFGALILSEVQLQGGRPQDARAFLAGHHDLVGARLGGGPPAR